MSMNLWPASGLVMELDEFVKKILSLLPDTQTEELRAMYKDAGEGDLEALPEIAEFEYPAQYFHQVKMTM